MIIQTRDFGELNINEEEIITVQPPILGFEGEDKYTLLIDDETDGMFSFLQSVKSPDVCFVLSDPALVTENYAPKLLPKTKKELGIKAGFNVIFKVITIIPDDFLKAAVNLKSPMVFCLSTKRATQVILEEDYPLRAPLCETEA